VCFGEHTSQTTRRLAWLSAIAILVFPVDVDTGRLPAPASSHFQVNSSPLFQKHRSKVELQGEYSFLSFSWVFRSKVERFGKE